jgi:hypothetical protein
VPQRSFCEWIREGPRSARHIFLDGWRVASASASAWGRRWNPLSQRCDTPSQPRRQQPNDAAACVEAESIHDNCTERCRNRRYLLLPADRFPRATAVYCTINPLSRLQSSTSVLIPPASTSFEPTLASTVRSASVFAARICHGKPSRPPTKKAFQSCTNLQLLLIAAGQGIQRAQRSHVKNVLLPGATGNDATPRLRQQQTAQCNRNVTLQVLFSQ